MDGQEATVRTGHGTTDWFQIGQGVHQGCILSPLFRFWLPRWRAQSFKSLDPQGSLLPSLFFPGFKKYVFTHSAGSDLSYGHTGCFLAARGLSSYGSPA